MEAKMTNIMDFKRVYLYKLTIIFWSFSFSEIFSIFVMESVVFWENQKLSFRILPLVA